MNRLRTASEVSRVPSVFFGTAFFCLCIALSTSTLRADGESSSASPILFLDSPASLQIPLERSDASERTQYEISVVIPGRKMDLSSRMPLEAGQTAATLQLNVKAQAARVHSTLSTEGELPTIPMGLQGGEPVEISLSREDVADAADYSIEVVNATNHEFSVGFATPEAQTLAFAAGQKTASFTLQAAFSRLDLANLRITRTDDPSDRLSLQLAVSRSPLATFESNFYVCFIKKIEFGSREVTIENPDGTTTTQKEVLYKGRWHYLTNGLRNTIVVAFCSVVLGAILGFLVAVIRSTHDRHGRLKCLNAIAKTYITIIRGTPMTVQLLIAYFIVFASVNNKILIAVLAFGFNSGAYVAEIIRAGIESIDAGQMEAARSLGLSYVQGMRKIVLPQAFRNVLPALGNEFIVLLKDTSIASFIGLDDLARGGSIIRSQTYQAYIPFLAVAAIYLVIVMFFTRLLGQLERRLRVSNAH